MNNDYALNKFELHLQKLKPLKECPNCAKQRLHKYMKKTYKCLYNSEDKVSKLLGRVNCLWPAVEKLMRCRKSFANTNTLYPNKTKK